MKHVYKYNNYYGTLIVLDLQNRKITEKNIQIYSLIDFISAIKTNIKRRKFVTKMAGNKNKYISVKWKYQNTAMINKKVS